MFLPPLIVQPLVYHSCVLALVALIAHSLLECAEGWFVQDGPRTHHVGQGAAHFQHVFAQLDAESAFVASARGRVCMDARHWVALTRDPALASRDVDDIGQQLQIQAHLGADVEGLAGRETRDGREIVVDDLEGGAGADVAAVEDAVLLAHVLEEGFGVLEGRRARRAHHERERAGLGAHRAAGDGGVDEVQRRAGRELRRRLGRGLCDFQDAGRLDRAALHDEFLLRVGLGGGDRAGEDARRRVEVDFLDGRRGG